MQLDQLCANLSNKKDTSACSLLLGCVTFGGRGSKNSLLRVKVLHSMIIFLGGSVLRIRTRNTQVKWNIAHCTSVQLLSKYNSYFAPHHSTFGWICFNVIISDTLQT